MNHAVIERNIFLKKSGSRPVEMQPEKCALAARQAMAHQMNDFFAVKTALGWNYCVRIAV